MAMADMLHLARTVPLRLAVPLRLIGRKRVEARVTPRPGPDREARLHVRNLLRSH